MLTLSKTLKLPDDAVTETFAIFGNRGTGKTTTAVVMAEEMLDRGQVVVVYDPTGAWYGLKSSKDGKAAGYPVVVFGGEHADVPLEESAGETIARVIVEKRIPAILDVSLLRKAVRFRFMTAFAETLYHLNREAVHFFIDEAHSIAPQNIRAMPEASKLLGAVEDIVLQGRRRGLGCTIISQRPALVNKNVSTQCQTMVAMRLVGKIDLDVIRDWVEVHADASQAKSMYETLPTMERGESWIWSPAWLKVFQRVKIRDRRTFDSSATPEAGKRQVAPKAWAEIDVAKLGEQIKATVEKAKADDPKELRKKIAALEKAAKTVAPAVVAAPDPTAVPKAIAKAIQGMERHNAVMAKRIASKLAGVSKDLGGTMDAISQAMAILEEVPNVHPAHAEQVKPVAVARVTSPIPETRNNYARSDAGDFKLSKAEGLILRAMYWLKDEVATPAKVGFYSGYSHSSGGFNNALGKLRSAGLIQGWQITDDGAGAISHSAGEKPTGSELREWLRSKLGRAENTILDVLVSSHPARLSNEQIGEAAGYSADSGGFNNALGKLRTIEAAEGYAKDGGTKASDVLVD